ncbi:DNA -binding domain-containing protein [Oceaniovalibus sp. ACAM 378]|uniref:DNA -binding domain-containing protein n=1 Tax=Oceaniovalibus sp. ACAM 378 TaxID=2599923 RepID=UPI0011D30537|nr:DUF2285 domain-containing protein [Oceaniovalibus sp. ACAM 378]TYB86095.1 DUF2285 domain-containing protein [Oceaniovalibus sp. ACAM 378]
MSNDKFLDKPPESAALTEYDRAHATLYMRLLDAAADGADWREVVSIVFEIDPEENPSRAHEIHEAHLARARWMTEHGYRQLLRGASH